MKNILITAPSLKSEDNISGISSLTKLLMKNNHSVHYEHFVLGRKDNHNRGVKWLFTQLNTPFILKRILNESHISLVHFNIGFEPPSLMRDILLFLYICRLGIPVVLHIHGGRFMSSIPSSPVLRKVIKIFLCRASSIIVLSEVEKTFLLENYSDIDGEINVLSNAISINDNKEAKDYSGVLKIIYLGRIDRKKGLKTIAETLNKLSDSEIKYEFSLCGVGPDKEWFINHLSPIAKESMIDRGLIYGESKEDILRKAHIFLLPSEFEGLPMALLESMSHGVVPLITPVGSIPSVVDDGVNGYYITSDIDTILKQLKSLDTDRETLELFSQRSQDTIRKKYSIDDYIGRLNTIYCSLLS